jgi:hypothetical protein
MYSNLSGALKYAEKKRTISRNRPRPPQPHYQNPIYNPRNNQINLEVPHRPAIIHPRNMMYANARGVRDVSNLQHYNHVYTRRQPLQPHQQQLLQQQHQHLLQLLQLQEHHKEMTDKFCIYNGYTKYFPPAPKLIKRASPKVASNNQQKLDGIKEKSLSRLSSTSKTHQGSRSSNNKKSPTNKGVHRNNTPKVLETTRILIV